ncbi:MAG: beta-ketoacyl-[acyl-carrier-protein] synthase family protein [Chitinispirillaceae bacterium]|nr:beta-ketoacyl-[acyl-carrier-protein] synthase family protein [Chitinispirillaceae bacterium]
MSSHRIFITGIGVAAPTAIGTDSFWRACLDGIAAVAPIPAHWLDYYRPSSTLWAPLPDFDYKHYNVNRIERMQIDTATVLGLCACKQALDDAKLTIAQRDEKKNTFTVEGINPDRCGVFLGTGMAGIAGFAFNQAFHCFSPIKKRLGDGTAADSLLRMPARFNPFAVSQIMPNATAASIGIKYSLTGPNTTFANACAAGTIAVGNGFRAIRSGKCSMAITGGTEYLGDEFGGVFRGFDSAKTLVRNCAEPDQANRPFDAGRSGFLFAEGGAAVLILESQAHAEQRGAQPIAEITAFVESFDAYSLMALDPEAGPIKTMIRSALDEAGLTPDGIDYVNAHATGTHLNDEIEARIIDEVFGKRPAINATKSLIGHTIGAAGAIETAVTALSIRDQTVHACKNLETPVRDLNFVTASGPLEIRSALKNSFGFGGHNASLVFTRA